MPTLNETRGKLIGFAFLPEGWHHKEGVPAKEHALKTALVILNDLEEVGFSRTDAYPGLDGGVMVSAYDLPDSYDFDVKPSGLITVAHERGDEDVFYQEKMTVKEVRGKIKEFGVSQCHTSDCLISGTTTAGSTGDLRVTPSRTQKMVPVSQLSRLTAPDANPEVFVNTVPDSTRRSQVLRLFSGRFRVRLSRAVGA